MSKSNGNRGPNGRLKPGTTHVVKVDTTHRVSLKRFGVVPGTRYRIVKNSVGVIMLTPTESPVPTIDPDDLAGGEPE